MLLAEELIAAVRRTPKRVIITVASAATPVMLAHRAAPGWTGPVSRRNRDRRPVPALGPRAQGVADTLLARVSQLQPCEHEHDGFSMWIATPPGMLLCKFCYQAARSSARTSATRRAGTRPEILTATRSWWSSSLTGSARTSTCASPASDSTCIRASTRAVWQ
jgi:hypothetical protein